MKTKVLIVDDHKLMRTALISLFSNQPDIEVVAEAGDGYSAIKVVQELSPDVVIMDIGMPDLNGIDATRRIIANNPDAKVIALSMHSDRRYVLEMLKAGASGYILKDCAFEELLQAIQDVISDRIYLSPKINELIVKHYIKYLSSNDPSLPSLLSDREREILQLLAEGKTSKEISIYPHISVKTVESHRQNLMDKVNIHSIAELTKFAIREGLTSLET